MLINENKLHNIIDNFYENNFKTIKTNIREQLKEKYNEKYSSLTVENVILDIFNNKQENINTLVSEIRFIQKNNQKTLTIPIINNSLNINISINNNYIVINSVNTKNIKDNDNIYNEINKYKFIYGINDKILQDYDNNEKINIIKNEIKNKDYVDITLYYKKIN